MAELKVITKGDVFDWDMGHGVETVQCAGRSPKVPDVIGFYTADDCMFVVKEINLAKFGLKYKE